MARISGFTFGRLLQSRLTFSVYLILLTFGTLSPNEPDRGMWNWLLGNQIVEKIVNFTLLMPLATFLFVQFGATLKRVLIFSFTTSVIIEGLQLFVPGRVSDLRDVLLNTSGSLLVTLFLRKLKTVIN